MIDVTDRDVATTLHDQPEAQLKFTTSLLFTAQILGALSATPAWARHAPLPPSIRPGNCQVIDQAIKALPASGGTVRLAAGTFICDKPLVIDRDNVTLLGAGRKRTLIKAKDATPIPVVIIGGMSNNTNDKGMLLTAEEMARSLTDNYWGDIPYPSRVTSNVELGGLTIDGNYHSHPKPGENECYDPRTGKSTNCGADSGFMIRNNGLTVRRAEHVRVNDIETRGAFSGGIVLEKKCVDVVMQNFSSTENYFDGFAGYETTQSRFTQFDVSKNQFSGISVDWGFTGNLFESGQANDNGDNGIFSSDVGGNTYRNLKLYNNKDLGIYVAGVFDKPNGNKPVPGTCDGNRIEKVEISGPKAGVVINSPCKNTVVSDAKVANAVGNCKWLFPGSDVKITNSTCTNAQGKTNPL